MRVLAVDFGFKRIGLAVGESDPVIATPRPSLTALGSLKRDAEQIGQFAKREQVEQVVVGLPLEPDGEPGRMAKICRQLADHLTNLGLKVALVDESLSSKVAEQTLRETNLTAAGRRKRIDGEAAVVIFERYIDEQTSP